MELEPKGSAKEDVEGWGGGDGSGSGSKPRSRGGTSSASMAAAPASSSLDNTRPLACDAPPRRTGKQRLWGRAGGRCHALAAAAARGHIGPALMLPLCLQAPR